MIELAEVKIQRRITEAFVAADYVVLDLVRTPRVSNGAGGRAKGTPEPLRPQRFRLVPSGDGAPERTTGDGLAVTPAYMLIGEYNADVQRFDEFVKDGRRYQIVFVNENRQYEVKGEAAYLGD
jgi:hypothetical protein